MALELAAVIGEHRFDGEGEHGLDEAKELRGGGAGVAAGGPGPSEMRMQIGAGNHVAALIGGPQLDAVQRHAMARMEGVKMLRLAQPWSAQGRAFAMGANALWAGAHFVRRLRDQPANGAGTRARQMAHRGEGQQQHMQLFFGDWDGAYAGGGSPPPMPRATGDGGDVSGRSTPAPAPPRCHLRR